MIPRTHLKHLTPKILHLNGSFCIFSPTGERSVALYDLFFSTSLHHSDESPSTVTYPEWIEMHSMYFLHLFCTLCLGPACCTSSRKLVISKQHCVVISPSEKLGGPSQHETQISNMYINETFITTTYI